jgi:hypothetical protein
MRGRLLASLTLPGEIDTVWLAIPIERKTVAPGSIGELQALRRWACE